MCWPLQRPDGMPKTQHNTCIPVYYVSMDRAVCESVQCTIGPAVDAVSCAYFCHISLWHVFCESVYTYVLHHIIKCKCKFRCVVGKKSVCRWTEQWMRVKTTHKHTQKRVEHERRHRIICHPQGSVSVSVCLLVHVRQMSHREYGKRKSRRGENNRKGMIAIVGVGSALLLSNAELDQQQPNGTANLWVN